MYFSHERQGMNKEKIQQRFNTASHSYDQVATIQKECAQMLACELIATWPDFYPATILDLGTGTGYLPQVLLPYFPQSQFTLNDLSPAMLARAQEKTNFSSQFQFQLGDIETSEFAFHDLIVSNLALQWMNNLETTLKRFYCHSKIMAFSCLLDGTFKEWDSLLQYHGVQTSALIYPTDQQLKYFLLSLNPADYVFTTREFKMTFDNARAFMDYLQQLGASVSQTVVPFSQMKNLIKGPNQPFDVTYQVFFGILKRVL